MLKTMIQPNKNHGTDGWVLPVENSGGSEDSKQWACKIWEELKWSDGVELTMQRT
jgi:hypothetical protein